MEFNKYETDRTGRIRLDRTLLTAMSCRSAGMPCTVDEHGQDNKIRCVPAGGTRSEHRLDIVHGRTD